MFSFFCGDTVIYPRCYGDKRLVYVGMANQLDFKNDCVVTYDGKACPATRSGLMKVITRVRDMEVLTVIKTISKGSYTYNLMSNDMVHINNIKSNKDSVIVPLSAIKELIKD